MASPPCGESLRIVFMGTPEFAARSLRGLIDARMSPVAVFTQPDRRSGRGRKLSPSPVKQCAQEAGIPVLQPQTLRTGHALDELTGLEPDLIIVVAYGLILPDTVLQLPRLGCWNVHASLLPRWRGAAPIQRAIEAGDPESGVCIMRMSSGLDEGPVFASTRTPISREDTAGSLHDRLAELGSDTLIDCLEQLNTGDLPDPVAQDDSKASYAPKLAKAEAELDFEQTAEILERRIRAFNPWPVCWCELGGERLRIWKASAIPGSALDCLPGQVIKSDNHGIDICSGAGTLRILELQRAGGRRMPVAEFLRAHEIGSP